MSYQLPKIKGLLGCKVLPNNLNTNCSLFQVRGSVACLAHQNDRGSALSDQGLLLFLIEERGFRIEYEQSSLLVMEGLEYGVSRITGQWHMHGIDPQRLGHGIDLLLQGMLLLFVTGRVKHGKLIIVTQG